MRILLVLWLLLGVACLSARTEPLYPLLGKAAVDSLQTRLRLSRPDTGRVALLLLLSRDQLARHDNNAPDLGPALHYGQQAAALSAALRFERGYLQSQFLLGTIINLQTNRTRGQDRIRQALARCRLLRNPALEAEGWYYLGETCVRAPERLPEKIACYARARELYQQAGDPLREAFVLKRVADMHLVQGNSAQALRELLRVLRLYRAAGTRHRHYAYDLLSALYRYNGDYHEAIRYGLAAIESAQATHDTTSLNVFYWRLARNYEELNQLDQALRYYRQGQQYNERRGLLYSQFDTAGDIAGLLIKQHRPQQALESFRAFMARHSQANVPREVIVRPLAECYLALGQYRTAETYYRELLALAAQPRDEQERASIYQSVSRFYFITRRYDKAQTYCRAALGLLHGAGMSVAAAQLHLVAFRIDSAQARFPAALAHYQRYKALSDSIFNTTKARQIASLQIRYDTRQKEQDINLLTKQTQVQQARIRAQEWQRNATLGGAVLLALLLGVSYNRYRLKRRSAEQLERQQRAISQQNTSLERVLREKDGLLVEKEELLTEKEWMLKELHHRVKNNLQIVSELLDSQTDQLQDAATLAVFRESQNRVQAMALVHQQLYQAQNLARVDMRAYIDELAGHLLASFDRASAVRLRLEVAALELPVALATPLGLILNEAVTNALKHAFPPPRTGTLTIRLTAVGPARYQLVVADDGVGLPAALDVAASRTMGLTMLKGLSEQIDAELTITRAEGVTVSLTFEAVSQPAPAAVRAD